ncbi:MULTISPECIES: hypothetical protein [unclassified Aeromicrobium]|uniref:hypothetical protein n=1 Tax=unclassified Aeromicrobium TaxID=2633570 RepID=UPI00288BFE06|nr:MULTISPECIES: hypothetical protein [unclassified Aeromicrobium]
MSTFGSSPQSGPGTNDHAPVDPATSPDTEPDADLPPTEPSLDASELEDDENGGEEGDDASS